MRSIKGCLDQPFVFLLKELRRRHTNDWDRAVDDRERLFRNDIADALSAYPRLVFSSGNISITTNIGKTDIDLIAYDPVTGVAGLFQLKWQDLFAHSMRERESKKRNFLKESNEWIKKVCCWLDENEPSPLLRSCGVLKSWAEQICDVKVFVIGRNFSHFSGEAQKDLRAAWGNWARLCIVLKENPNLECPLSFVFDSFQNDSPFSRFTLESNSNRLEIEGLTVVLRSN